MGYIAGARSPPWIVLATIPMPQRSKDLITYNDLLTQNFYHNCWYQNPKYPIIGYMDPHGDSIYVFICIYPYINPASMLF